MPVREGRQIAVLEVNSKYLEPVASGVEVDIASTYINYIQRPIAGIAHYRWLVTDVVETDYGSVARLLKDYLGVRLLDKPVKFTNFTLAPYENGVRLESARKGEVLATGALKKPLPYYGADYNVESFLRGRQNFVKIMAAWSTGIWIAKDRNRYLIYSDDFLSYGRHRVSFETYPYILRKLLFFRDGGSKHRHHISYSNGQVSFSGEDVKRVDFDISVSRIFPTGYAMLERFEGLSRAETSAVLQREDLLEYNCGWG